MDTLEAMLGDAWPGAGLSKKTVPEIGQLIQDLRQMAQSLSSVADKIDQGGARPAWSAARNSPDYASNK